MKETDRIWQWRIDGVNQAISRRLVSSKEELAQKIGTTGSNLINILRRRSERTRFTPLLDDWLKRNVYNAAVSAAPQNADLDASFRIISARLRFVCDLIESNASSISKANAIFMLSRDIEDCIKLISEIVNN